MAATLPAEALEMFIFAVCKAVPFTMYDPEQVELVVVQIVPEASGKLIVFAPVGLVKPTVVVLAPLVAVMVLLAFPATVVVLPARPRFTVVALALPTPTVPAAPVSTNTEPVVPAVKDKFVAAAELIASEPVEVTTGVVRLVATATVPVKLAVADIV